MRRVIALVAVLGFPLIGAGCGDEHNTPKSTAGALTTTARPTATHDPRRDAQTLVRKARRALARGHATSARRLAREAQALHKTSAARSVLRAADAAIAKQE